MCLIRAARIFANQVGVGGARVSPASSLSGGARAHARERQRPRPVSSNTLNTVQTLHIKHYMIRRLCI